MSGRFEEDLDTLGFAVMAGLKVDYGVENGE